MHDRNGPGGALAAATKPDINNPDLSYSLPVFFFKLDESQFVGAINHGAVRRSGSLLNYLFSKKKIIIQGEVLFPTGECLLSFVRRNAGRKIFKVHFALYGGFRRPQGE
jgi:hypothetical protein